MKLIGNLINLFKKIKIDSNRTFFPTGFMCRIYMYAYVQTRQNKYPIVSSFVSTITHYSPAAILNTSEKFDRHKFE